MRTEVIHACKNCRCKLKDQTRDTELCDDCMQEFIPLRIPMWVVLVVIMVIGLVMWSGSSIPSAYEAASSYREGKKAFMSDDFQKASALLSKAHALRGNDIELAVWMGMAAYYSGDHSTFNKILSTLPEELVFIDNDLSEAWSKFREDVGDL